MVTQLTPLVSHYCPSRSFPPYINNTKADTLAQHQKDGDYGARKCLCTYVIPCPFGMTRIILCIQAEPLGLPLTQSVHHLLARVKAKLFS